jgi:hypothetical protein
MQALVLIGTEAAATVLEVLNKISRLSVPRVAQVKKV